MSVAAPARIVRRGDATPATPVAPFGRTAGGRVTLRTATAADADAIHALVMDHLAEGHLLPRRREEIALRAHRFVVALEGDRIVGCGELAPLSRTVAEVRSLVVTDAARSGGIGRRIVDELRDRGAAGGFEKLCALTHTPGYFVRMGFSIVPHAWLPEKIGTDCSSCAQFRTCGQYAVVQTLGRVRQGCVPLTALHG